MPYPNKFAVGTATAPALSDAPEKAASKSKKSVATKSYADGKASVVTKKFAAARSGDSGKLSPAQVALDPLRSKRLRFGRLPMD